MSTERFDLDALDLDDLLSDDINIDFEEDENDLNHFENIEKIEQPHIMVTTKDFKELIRLAKYIITNNAKDIVSKSVALQVRDGKVVGYTTDQDVFLEFNMDLLNTENILEEPICFPIDSILKMLKALPHTTALIKDEEGFKVRLLGGYLPLETHNLEITKFKFEDELEESVISIMDSTKFNSILRDLGAVAIEAQSPNERRIVFDDKGAYSNYMFTITKAIGNFPKMDVKIKDLNILKVLTSNKEANLMFFDTADKTKSKRKVIKSDKFSYAFLIGDQGVNKTLISMENELVLEEGLFIDTQQLLRIVELSTDLNYSLGKLGLNFTDDNRLEIAFKTKRGKDSMFFIDGTSEGLIKPLKKSLEIPSKFLKTLLSSFTKDSTIRLHLMEKAIVVHTENYQGMLFIAN